MKIRHVKNYFFAFFLLLFTGVHAGSMAFSLTVSATPETCTGNGTLTFSVADAPAGSSIIYTIYKLPDLTDDVSTQATNFLGGLTAGTYRVIANVTVDGTTESQSADAVIANSIVNLAYGFSSTRPLCGVPGTITVNVSQGTAVSYEIISGPVTLAPQTSNVLEGLVAGVYEIRVIDSCGEGWVQTYTLLEGNSGINFGSFENTVMDCENIHLSIQFGPAPGMMAAYPMTVEITVNPPQGEPILISAVLTGPDDDSGTVVFEQTVPFFEGEVFSYTVDITDNCGNQFSTSYIIAAETADPQATTSASGCDGANIIVSNVSEVILIEAPAAYQGLVPGDFTAQIQGNMVIIPGVPPGEYVFTVKDICGEEHELSVVVVEGSGGFTPSASVVPGCGAGVGGLVLQGGIQTAILLAAPAGFAVTLPADYTSQINPFNSVLALNNLPAGNYQFEVSNECGDLATVNASVAGYQTQTTVDITELCGTFNLFFNTQTNAMGASYWLQRYFPDLDYWGHPITQQAYNPGTSLDDENAIILNNGTNNLNFSMMGQFRIIKMYIALAGGSFSFVDCFDVIHEFEFNNLPEITNVFSFSCSNGDFDVIVEAQGMPVLQYRITQKNGEPFVVNNGTSNVFTGLEPAQYNFEVRDGCNNIVNRQFSIAEPFAFVISATGFCVGQTAALSVPPFPFLNYQWFANSNPAEILSTGASLEFDEFSSGNAGVYTVVISGNNPQSCILQNLQFTVPEGTAPVQAGAPNPTVHCLSAPLDLYTLVAAPFDQGGEWEALSGGSVTGNSWDPAGLEPGIYLFNYTVANDCGSQTVQTSVNLSQAPSQITATSAGAGCAGSAIILTALGDPSYQYTWTLPDGSQFSGQELHIEQGQPENSGIYWVTANLGECATLPVSVQVEIQAPPMAMVNSGCEGAVRWLSAQAIENSFDPMEVEYSWSGPGGFTASGNPVDISSGSPGEYSVTLSTTAGCESSHSITVANVKCLIPLGISPNDDGLNDSFDLESFEVANLQVFNRYGVTVYEKSNYISEWYGQDFKGRMLPAGAYYFLIRLADGAHESGWVYVNREH